MARMLFSSVPPPPSCWSPRLLSLRFLLLLLPLTLLEAEAGGAHVEEEMEGWGREEGRKGGRKGRDMGLQGSESRAAADGEALLH